eukprot:1519910-Alexandrium_andersonii.AAC.1
MLSIFSKRRGRAYIRRSHASYATPPILCGTSGGPTDNPTLRHFENSTCAAEPTTPPFGALLTICK